MAWHDKTLHTVTPIHIYLVISQVYMTVSQIVGFYCPWQKLSIYHRSSCYNDIPIWNRTFIHWFLFRICAPEKNLNKNPNITLIKFKISFELNWIKVQINDCVMKPVWYSLQQKPQKNALSCVLFLEMYTLWKLVLEWRRHISISPGLW